MEGSSSFARYLSSNNNGKIQIVITYMKHTTNINDPSILYTCSQVELDKANNETPKSLFTINPDKLN